MQCPLVLYMFICDHVRGNQAFGFEIEFEIRAKNLADSLLQRKCVFHTKVLHDVCGTQLCSLVSQNLLLEPSTHGHVELLPECAERLYGEISEAVCGFQARHLAANFQPEREPSPVSSTYRVGAMTTTEDITRLLNL